MNASVTRILVGTVIAAMVVKAGWERVKRWLVERKPTSSNPTETWSFDWNSVTPGKALAEYVGPEWVNWILWPIAFVLALLLVQFMIGMIRNIIGKPAAGGKSASTLTAGVIFGWVAFGAIVFGAVTLVGHFFGGGSTVGKSATLPIVQVGEVKTSPLLHVAGVYSMGEPRRQPGEYHVGCARVIEPAWVTNHPETPRWQLVNTTKQDSSWVDLRLTPEMQALLTQNGVSHVRLELTRVTTTYADTVNNLPCRHLRWNPDS